MPDKDSGISFRDFAAKKRWATDDNVFDTADTKPLRDAEEIPVEEDDSEYIEGPGPPRKNSITITRIVDAPESDEEVEVFKTRFSFKKFVLLLFFISVGLGYFFLFDIGIRGDVYSLGEEINPEGGMYAVYVEAGDFDCDSDNVSVQYLGTTILGDEKWYNLSKKDKDTEYLDYKISIYKHQCFVPYDKNGWTFAGFLEVDSSSTKRVMVDGVESQEVAIVWSPVIGLIPDPIFGFGLLFFFGAVITLFLARSPVEDNDEDF